jgi:hypothetical protein
LPKFLSVLLVLLFVTSVICDKRRTDREDEGKVNRDDDRESREERERNDDRRDIEREADEDEKFTSGMSVNGRILKHIGESGSGNRKLKCMHEHFEDVEKGRKGKAHSSKDSSKRRNFMKEIDNEFAVADENCSSVFDSNWAMYFIIVPIVVILLVIAFLLWKRRSFQAI